MIAVFLAPLVVFTLIIHAFERISQRRLAERFGWNAVLWTGWLGTPIHELSHVVMCWLFRHRIDEVVLFEPDQQSGRLGYVRHSYRHDNGFETIGNVFIGIAPLIGGSLVLTILLLIFYFDAAVGGFRPSPNEEGQALGLLEQTFAMTRQIGSEIFTLKNLASVRLWLFLYLVLCVGSHMAPSRSDYEGASRGVFWLATGLTGIALTLVLVGVQLDTAIYTFLSATAPLFAVLSLTVFLVGLATALVWLATSFIKPKYTLRQ